MIAATFSGSGFKASPEIKWPKQHASSCCNHIFGELNCSPIFLALSNDPQFCLWSGLLIDWIPKRMLIFSIMLSRHQMSHLLLGHGERTHIFHKLHFFFGWNMPPVYICSFIVISKWQYICSASFPIVASSVTTLIFSFFMSNSVVIS